MYCIYDTLEVTTVSELKEHDYFIILNESDIIRKTDTGYDLKMFEYNKKVVYQKESNVEAISVNSGEKIEIDSDRLIQKVKILDPTM